MRRTRYLSMAALVACLVLSACGGGSELAAGEDGLTPVKFGISSTVSAAPTIAVYTVVPARMGYFEEEGLKVKFLGFDGSGENVQALDAGQVDVAMPSAISLFTPVSQGIDMKAFYSQITSNYILPQVPEDSDIHDVLDLQGKTVGVQDLASANIPMIQSMVKSEGGDPDAVEFVATGEPNEALAFLRSGQIDAVALYDAAYAQFEALGEPMREISTQPYRQLGFQQVLATKGATLKENRELMVGFGRAIAKAAAFSRANPEATIRMYWDAFPEAKPTGVSDAVAMKQALQMLKARAEHTRLIHDTYGFQTDEQIQGFMDVIIDSEGLEPFDIADVWDPSLLEKINDFDREAIRQQAMSFHQEAMSR